MRQLLLWLTAAVWLSSCGGRQSPAAQQAADTVAFSYARLLHVERHDGFSVVRIAHPWKAGKTLHTYVLVPRDAAEEPVVPARLSDATVVRVPLQRSIVFTSVHCALLSELQAEHQLAGVADLKYIKVPWIQDGVRQGTLCDCGDGLSPLVEKIIDANADAILLSPFENSGGYGRLEEIGTPLIECAEYMEASPLARAEWVRFYGMLYGKERQADSLFARVDSSYHAQMELAATSGVRRSVIVDKQTGPVWYVPGGRSTIGQMLSDAQCDYAFSADTHSGSLSLPFETVLERSGNAEVWLFRYDSDRPMTRERLLSEQYGYKQLRAVREGDLYGCNVMTSMFYEETPFRPDLLLADFITILHPDLPDRQPLRYYIKVE